MRANGVEFLSTPPDAYYEMLKEKGWNVKENIDELQKLGILCDVEGKGYLLTVVYKTYRR